MQLNPCIYIYTHTWSDGLEVCAWGKEWRWKWRPIQLNQVAVFFGWVGHGDVCTDGWGRKIAWKIRRKGKPFVPPMGLADLLSHHFHHLHSYFCRLKSCLRHMKSHLMTWNMCGAALPSVFIIDTYPPFTFRFIWLGCVWWSWILNQRSLKSRFMKTDFSANTVLVFG